MTCIVAIRDGESLLFGADSAATGPPGTRWEKEIYNIPEPKVFARGPYLFGVCGSYRVAQVIRYRAELPGLPNNGEIQSFLVRELVPAIGDEVERTGLPKPPGLLGDAVVVLIGIVGQLWAISTDMTVTRTPNDYAAIGSGRHRAYGALHALELAGVEPSPRRRAEIALQAAAKYTTDVRPPFHFVSTENPEPDWAPVIVSSESSRPTDSI